MLRSRWAVVAALLPVLLTTGLWVAGTFVHSLACPAWCLMCVNTCPVGGVDLSWLVAWGVIGHYFLALTGPISALLLAVVVLLRRR